jgi:hypothetical protein
LTDIPKLDATPEPFEHLREISQIRGERVAHARDPRSHAVEGVDHLLDVGANGHEDVGRTDAEGADRLDAGKDRPANLFWFQRLHEMRNGDDRRVDRPLHDVEYLVGKALPGQFHFVDVLIDLGERLDHLARHDRPGALEHGVEFLEAFLAPVEHGEQFDKRSPERLDSGRLRGAVLKPGNRLCEDADLSSY